MFFFSFYQLHDHIKHIEKYHGKLGQLYQQSVMNFPTNASPVGSFSLKG